MARFNVPTETVRLELMKAGDVMISAGLPYLVTLVTPPAADGFISYELNDGQLVWASHRDAPREIIRRA